MFWTAVYCSTLLALQILFCRPKGRMKPRMTILAVCERCDAAPVNSLNRPSRKLEVHVL
ncbi:hypothetical protein BaRGS_00028641, partial [Batillaria attramentaria]